MGKTNSSLRKKKPKTLKKEFILGHPFLEGLLQPQLQI
jgi:hypothetical protein